MLPSSDPRGQVIDEEDRLAISCSDRQKVNMFLVREALMKRIHLARRQLYPSVKCFSKTLPPPDMRRDMNYYLDCDQKGQFAKNRI